MKHKLVFVLGTFAVFLLGIASYLSLERKSKKSRSVRQSSSKVHDISTGLKQYATELKHTERPVTFIVKDP